MGVDLHGLRFLQFAYKHGPLGDVATLGRQSVHVDAARQRALLHPAPEKPYGPYCEELLIERFGATSITSFDASDYEQASVVHDMNTPLKYHRTFDTVIDFGTLEHVFNLQVAFLNVAELCRKGGRIIHALPGNNFSGHGFYQFSPELFFSLYSAENGFTDTKVFIAELNDREHWWEAAAPADGLRIEYTSGQRSNVLAVTRKVRDNTRQAVQQSDYISTWREGGHKPHIKPSSIRESLYKVLKSAPLLWRWADVIAQPINTYENAEYHRLSEANPGYIRVNVDDVAPPR